MTHPLFLAFFFDEFVYLFDHFIVSALHLHYDIVGNETTDNKSDTTAY